MPSDYQKKNAEVLADKKDKALKAALLFSDNAFLLRVSSICVKNVRDEFQDFISKRGGLSTKQDYYRALKSIHAVIVDNTITVLVDLPDDLIARDDEDPDSKEADKDEKKEQERQKKEEESRLKEEKDEKNRFIREEIRRAELEKLKKVTLAKAKSRARSLVKASRGNMTKKQVEEFIKNSVNIMVRKFDRVNKPIMSDEERIAYIKEDKEDKKEGKKKIVLKKPPKQTEGKPYVHPSVAKFSFIRKGMEKSMGDIEKLVDRSIRDILK